MNYTGIENALYTYLYKSAFAIIDQYTRGEAARQLREMFQVYIDLINVAYCPPQGGLPRGLTSSAVPCFPLAPFIHPSG